MDLSYWLLPAVFVVGVVALSGFFATKVKGFGRFATSTLLLLLVVVVSALLFAAGRLEAQVIANIFFAVIGFAGGLFTGKEREAESARQPAKSVGAAGGR